MNRRRFLEMTVTAGTIGLLAGCMNSDAAGNGSTTDDDGDPTTDEQTPTETETTTTDEITTEDDEPIGEGTTTEGRSGSVGWASGGTMDGVSFEFSSDPPECSGESEMAAIDEADVEFDTDGNEIVVEGVISGSDLCKRARLADLSHDRVESHLSIAIESIDREDCDAGGQCITEISYEGTFSFEDGVPKIASVSHDGRGITSAAHESGRVTPPDETTDE